MDILNERDDDWDKRDWDNMPLETVEALAIDALNQVNGLLADSEYIFTEKIGERLVRRLKGKVVWVCRKHNRGTLAGILDTSAHDVAKRANIPIPRLYRL